MELPSRNDGDKLLKPGECLDIRRRLRRLTSRHDLTAVAVCAFDWRTRMLPFHFSSTHMAPAGVRAIGSALVDSGINRVRIVLQQWSPRVRPSRMALDGRVPDLLLVSSMQIHAAACHALIRDACRLPPESRPLIIAGGPLVIYEPWSVFSADSADPWAADVAVTGEEYVLLNLLEVLLTERAGDEPLRAAFVRARDRGSLEQVPGLVYARGGGAGEELVDTGIQRLVDDLDELPSPVLGYPLLEPPSHRTTLAARPIEPRRLHWLNPVGAMVFTLGCKFSCPYCPIPAYNQHQYRTKSTERIAEEMTQIYERFGIRYFFGTDDNFFNDPARTLSVVQTLSRMEIGGQPLRHLIRWGTEVTVHDTLAMKDHLETIRKAGARALWLGVEDLTATFVKKGQSVDKTLEAFRLLRRHGIMPVPMLMHHDGQPLITRNSSYGLINQVRLLRQAGAISMQVLVVTPAVGARDYEEIFRSGRMMQSAAGKPVEPYMLDGNYVVATAEAKPWRMQLRITAALAYFYNPFRLLGALIWPRSGWYWIDVSFQFLGCWGLLCTLPRIFGWTLRLMTGKIKWCSQLPDNHPRLVGVGRLPASHGNSRTPKKVPAAAGSPR
ncbi:MAG: radical SAM protein [Phycisphaerae bacterium]